MSFGSKVTRPDTHIKQTHTWDRLLYLDLWSAYQVVRFGRVQWRSSWVCIVRRRCSSSWCSWLLTGRRRRVEGTVHTVGPVTCWSRRSTISTSASAAIALPPPQPPHHYQQQQQQQPLTTTMMMTMGELTMLSTNAGQCRSHSHHTCCLPHLLYIRMQTHTPSYSIATNAESLVKNGPVFAETFD